MRTPNISSALFSPDDPPDDPAQLQRYLRDLNTKLAAVIALLAAGHIDMVNVAPSKPRIGDVRLADGVNWNPGAGIGVYCYYGAAWHFLG